MEVDIPVEESGIKSMPLLSKTKDTCMEDFFRLEKKPKVRATINIK